MCFKDAVVPDGFSRATLLSLLCQRALFGCDRLLINDGHTDFLIAPKNTRRSAPAHVAVDTARIYVKSAGNVLG